MSNLAVIREVDHLARLAPTAVVGPYCVVGPHVTIGPHTVLERRVIVSGHTTIGSNNFIGEGCVLGADPQDLKYGGGTTLLTIGHRNRFGRCVTAHIGTETGGYLTRIGNDNTLGDGCHIAHDCYVDDRATLGRNVLLAGHIRVETGSKLDDMSAVHHFVTIGRYANVGRCMPVRRDVPPYTRFEGRGNDITPTVTGIHEQGVQNAGLSKDDQQELRRALKDLFSEETALQTRIEQLVNLGVEGEVAYLCEFCQQSLQGVYGRHREQYRGKVPPEAMQHLPVEILQAIRRAMP
jgi:UDP-N-acetylglucosamine acyltransferase